MKITGVLNYNKPMGSCSSLTSIECAKEMKVSMWKLFLGLLSSELSVSSECQRNDQLQ